MDTYTHTLWYNCFFWILTKRAEPCTKLNKLFMWSNCSAVISAQLKLDIIRYKNFFIQWCTTFQTWYNETNVYNYLCVCFILFVGNITAKKLTE